MAFHVAARSNSNQSEILLAENSADHVEEVAPLADLLGLAHVAETEGCQGLSEVFRRDAQQVAKVTESNWFFPGLADFFDDFLASTEVDVGVICVGAKKVQFLYKILMSAPMKYTMTIEKFVVVQILLDDADYL